MAWWLDDPATELKFALRSDSSSSLDLAWDPLVWVRCLAAVLAPRTARGSGDSSVSSADRAPATFRSAGREPRELRMGLRFPGWKVRRPQEVLPHKSVELGSRTLIPSSSSSLGATSPTSPASPRPLPGHPHPCVSSGLLVFPSPQYVHQSSAFLISLSRVRPTRWLRPNNRLSPDRFAPSSAPSLPVCAPKKGIYNLQ